MKKKKKLLLSSKHSILFKKLSGKKPHHSSAALLNVDAIESSNNKHPADRSKSCKVKNKPRCCEIVCVVGFSKHTRYSHCTMP